MCLVWQRALELVCTFDTSWFPECPVCTVPWLCGASGLWPSARGRQGRQLHLGPLHAPQARQERKAAYEVTSNDVTKWQPMVKVRGVYLNCAQWRVVDGCRPAASWLYRLATLNGTLCPSSRGRWQHTAVLWSAQANREAPTLAFSKPRGGAAKATTTAALTAQHLPETDMEAEVAAMLQAAGMHSAKAVEEAEDALALKVGACACSLATPPLLHRTT